jgi:hypothetical protein
MALVARDNRISRRSWLLAGMAIPLSRLRAAESLKVSFDGDNLRVAAPSLHFLTGKPLERLQDAATVTYLSQLTLFSDAHGTVYRRAAERLVVSYDLWEEKFSVTIPGRGQRRPFQGGAAQAEAWCLDNLAISALGFAPERPFWLRFDLRTADRRELASVMGDSGLSLTALIDLFSRKAGAGDLSWTANAGPLRLLDLPRTPSGRGRIG